MATFPVTEDRRVRLRAKPGSAASEYIYGDGLLKVLNDTNGMVWVNTPTISLSQEVTYHDEVLTHANGGYASYKSTPNPTISVSGDFKSATPTDAYYALACLHFVRSMVKNDFGAAAMERNQAGTPPPVLLFSAYGAYSFNNIPVIIKSYDVEFSSEVDYIEVPVSSYSSSISNNLSSHFDAPTKAKDKTWIPQSFSISLSLQQQPTPDYATYEFDLKAFKNGDLIKKGGLF